MSQRQYHRHGDLYKAYQQTRARESLKLPHPHMDVSASEKHQQAQEFARYFVRGAQLHLQTHDVTVEFKDGDQLEIAKAILAAVSTIDLNDRRAKHPAVVHGNSISISYRVYHAICESLGLPIKLTANGIVQLSENQKIR